MKLLKCTQLALEMGLVAGALLVGGVAMADTAPAASSTAYPSGFHDSSNQKYRDSVDTSGSNVQNNYNSTGDDGTVTSSGGSLATPANGNAGSETQTQASVTSDQSQTSPVVTGGGSSTIGSSLTGGTSVSQVQTDALNGSSESTTVNPPNNSGRVTPVTGESSSGGGSSASASEGPSSKPLDSVVIGSETLAIQPTIVSIRSDVLAGYAMALPTIPASHSKMPVPPRTNGGILGVFTAALASVLVPQTFAPHVPAASGQSLTTLLVLLIISFASMYIYNYGQWLRRSGFVTAPRSDEPWLVNQLSSLFATPHSLGYESASPHDRSPLLMAVLETKRATHPNKRFGS